MCDSQTTCSCHGSALYYISLLLYFHVEYVYIYMYVWPTTELACATCHLIFEKEMYDTLPEKEPEEDDMLDLAMELTDTSRLGCQIRVRKDMDGMKVRIPDDGY